MIISSIDNKIISINSSIKVKKLEGFDDPTFNELDWMKLLLLGDTNTVNLTWQWQRLWWETFGQGELLLLLVEENGVPIALAPLFTNGGMIFNLCPEDSLDFIGDLNDPCILDSILITARKNVKNFLGFLFYFIPEFSRTGQRLKESSERLGFVLVDEGSIPSPWINIKGQPEKAEQLTRKKSLRYYENYFLQNGDLHIAHFQKAEDILNHLESFFEQHIKRRTSTPAPSIFLDNNQRVYYRRITENLSHTGWLRFTAVYWNGNPIAYHYGLSYNGRYLFCVPAFDIDLAAHSPGQVLLRQVLLAAIGEGASSFDFGIGEEPYKYRFASDVTLLHHFGLYPVK